MSDDDAWVDEALNDALAEPLAEMLADLAADVGRIGLPTEIATEMTEMLELGRRLVLARHAGDVVTEAELTAVLGARLPRHDEDD